MHSHTHTYTYTCTHTSGSILIFALNGVRGRLCPDVQSHLILRFQCGDWVTLSKEGLMSGLCGGPGATEVDAERGALGEADEAPLAGGPREAAWPLSPTKMTLEDFWGFVSGFWGSKSPIFWPLVFSQRCSLRQREARASHCRLGCQLGRILALGHLGLSGRPPPHQISRPTVPLLGDESHRNTNSDIRAFY